MVQKAIGIGWLGHPDLSASKGKSSRRRSPYLVAPENSKVSWPLAAAEMLLVVDRAELFRSGGVPTMVAMRHWPACLLVALAVTGCAGIGVAPAASPSPGDRSLAPDPCSGYTCSGPGAQLNVAYPYRLHTHCGVLSTWFDGRAFYVEAVDPSAVTGGLDNPEELGTMTLLSPHTAVFRSSAGTVIRFVDALPGVIGEPYPFRVYVLSGGNQLIDRGFAGRLWQADGSLPGVTGPSPGPKGQDALTSVEGTMTLISRDMAVFRDWAGGEVRFKLRGPVGCM